MFLHLCVILFMGGGGSAHPHLPVGRPGVLGRPPWLQTPQMQTSRMQTSPDADPPWMQTPLSRPPRICQQAGGMHPTGMHTCFVNVRMLTRFSLPDINIVHHSFLLFLGFVTIVMIA